MSVTFPPQDAHHFIVCLDVGIVKSLTIYHDGQFWIGIIEVVENGKLRALL
ncbi:DUF2992 family protein [Priestia megaterium]